MKSVSKSRLYLLIALTALLFGASKAFENREALGLGEKMTNFIAGAMFSLAIGLIVVFFIIVFSVIRAKSKK